MAWAFEGWFSMNEANEYIREEQRELLRRLS
jgi:predicted NUDIX family NTP pyrophosphohydrolase